MTNVSVGLVTALLLMLPLAAESQQVALDTSAVWSDSTPRIPDTSRAGRLDRIIITAVRLPAELSSATYAAARNAADVTWRARPGLGLAEPLHGIPGVQVDNRYNFSLGERITVRGFGARTQFGVRGVRVLVDGIPATMPDGQTTLNHLDLGTVRSVEVVRTPVAAAHGNAAGGVIAVQTFPPPPEPIAASSRLVTGSHGLARQQLNVGGTTGAGSYLVHAGRLDYDGFRAHSSAQSRYFAARSRSEIGSSELSVTLHQVRFDASNPGALSDSLVRTAPEAASPTNVSQNAGQNGRHTEAGLLFRQPIGGLRLLTSAYGVRRSFENPIVPRIIDLSRRAGGVRASIGADTHGRVAWESGVEAAVQNDDRVNHTNVAGERGALTLDQEETVRANALFAAARIAAGERVALQLGVRHDATEFSVSDRLVTATNPDDSGERVMRAWSPSAGISVALGRNAYAFVNAGSSFETPTTTELANQPDGAGGFNPQLRPQRTRSLEIGSNWFQERTYYQVAAYYSRVSGALVPFEVPGTPGRQFFRNAASAVHRGAEAMLGGRIAQSIEARIAYTYTDARYDEYEVSGTSHAGNRIPGVAPHRVETLLRISRRSSFIDLESRYQSRLPVDDGNSAHSASYVIHGVRFGVPGLRWGGFSGAPYAGVENLLNRRYNSAVTVNAAGGRFYEPGPPRAVFLGLDLSLRGTSSR